jgi:hypothetical protein
VIRFGAIVSVVSVAIGLLIAGAVSGKLLLVYVSIGLAALALLMLIVGVAVWRDEVFGPTAAGATEGSGRALAAVDDLSVSDDVAVGARRGEDAAVASAGRSGRKAADRTSAAVEPEQLAAESATRDRPARDRPARASAPAELVRESVAVPAERAARESAESAESARSEPVPAAAAAGSRSAERDTRRSSRLDPAADSLPQPPGAEPAVPAQPPAARSGRAAAPAADRTSAVERSLTAEPSASKARPAVPERPSTLLPPPAGRADSLAARPEAGRSPADVLSGPPSVAGPPTSAGLPPAAHVANAASTGGQGASATSAGSATASGAAPEGASAAAGPAIGGPDHGGAATGDAEVLVVPGIARYHKAGCILIRFLGAEDLETMTRQAAEASGCVPCRACRPDKAEGE